METQVNKYGTVPAGILLPVPGISGVFLQDLRGSGGRNLRRGKFKRASIRPSRTMPEIEALDKI